MTDRNDSSAESDEATTLADKIAAWSPSSKGPLAFIARERRLIEDALRTFSVAQSAQVTAIIAAAEEVCSWDWSVGDTCKEALQDMHRLQEAHAAASQPSPAATVETIPDDVRATEDMTLAHNARQAAINESMAAVETTYEIVQRVKEACAQVADRAVERFGDNESRASMAEEIAASIRALIPAPQRSSAGNGQVREALEIGRCYVEAYRNAAQVKRDYAKAFGHDAELALIDAALVTLNEPQEVPATATDALSHADLCVLSRIYNDRECSVHYGTNFRINEWLKAQIASALTRPHGGGEK